MVPLENLHVYGNLLKLYDLPALGASILEAGELYREMRILEVKLLTLYASYILAQKGFYLEVWTAKDISPEDRWYTTKFEDEKWIEHFEYFPPEQYTIHAFLFDWEEYYRNERGERLKVIFVIGFLAEMDINEKGGVTIDTKKHLFSKLDTSCSNLVLVHPKLSRRNVREFMEIKEKMKQSVGQDIILSTGEFVAKFIPDSEKRHVVEENWKSLRRKIVENLRKKYSILIKSIHEQELSEVDKRIRASRLKYESLLFDDAIKDAGVACEGLLQVLYSIFVSKKTVGELTFNDLQCALREVLTEKFGSIVYGDLEFIRNWRNNVVHPGRQEPNDAITLQVITRAELFHKLFLRHLLKKNEAH